MPAAGRLSAAALPYLSAAARRGAVALDRAAGRGMTP